MCVKTNDILSIDFIRITFQMPYIIYSISFIGNLFEPSESRLYEPEYNDLQKELR